MDELKIKRRQLGLTQQRLADLAGIKLSMIADIESGRQNPNDWTFERLQSILETNPLKVMECQVSHND